MTHYHVFYGAPAVKDLGKPCGHLEWRTATSRNTMPPPLTLAPATLAAASRRISMMYENVIFRESQDPGESYLSSGSPAAADRPSPGGQTTIITWPETTQASDDVSRSKVDVTFLRPTASISRIRETEETQETDSYNYSDVSSIVQFPAFHFSLHALTPLDTLINQAEAARARHMPKTSHKVTVLAAVLEAEGPDAIRVKKGPDAGKEVSLLKLILGDESGGIVKLTVWRQTADDWGGLNPAVLTPPVKKGDIVLLDNVLASWEPESGSTTATIPISLSASPQLKSRMEICYRTMPSVPQDARLRPDLRLGLSDAAMRKVALVVRWFEGVAGLS
ncbi:hypothetical protein BD413DRAFT_477912 [Trametes elegans]|nr:hypothetical protein BD413DRAFT_477912 [Trametes elegans]